MLWLSGHGAITRAIDKLQPVVHVRWPFTSIHECQLAFVLQNTQKEGERTQLLGSEQNYYKQLYLESSGKPGDLRISEVTFGDPAAQGSIFVHERI